MRAPALVLVVPLVLLVTACDRGPVRATHVVDATGQRRALTEPWPSPRKLDALLDARVRLVGADVPAHAKPGEKVTIELAFLVEKSCAGAEPKVFVHAAAPGAEVNQAQADHIPLDGKVPALEWQPGDLLVDTAELVVPSTIGVDTLVVMVGLYEGKDRWKVTPSSAHDGKDRVEVGRIHVDGAPPVAVTAEIHKRKGAIVVDGVLDEPDWAEAPKLGPFIAYDGKSRITRPTFARLLWDTGALYVAFEGEDPDVFTPYTKDDDPLYDSEAVEIFVDADGDKDVYVELQDAPAKDLHFDAAFAGGRRKNMDRVYTASYATKSVVTTTSFVSEWKIDVASLKDVPAGEPRAGASWKVNLFRLERVRDDGRQKVLKSEASAWSSPLSGDFHNLDRFGTVTFVE
jgi:hypothetical protein